ncbi:hypothetical protein [Burkholderia cepacia]|uniref:hypothetical protein n=1 Tax=Burkholderia cepacia TaxID=292 RepID=UPI0012D8EC3B
MTTERDVLANRSEARQECLRPPRQSKAAHASLEFALGLMTVLGAAAHARSRSDENMLTLATSGSVTILFGAEHSLEEALGHGLVTPLRVERCLALLFLSVAESARESWRTRVSDSCRKSAIDVASVS